MKAAQPSGISILAPAQPCAPLCPRAEREDKSAPCIAGLTGGTPGAPKGLPGWGCSGSPCLARPVALFCRRFCCLCFAERLEHLRQPRQGVPGDSLLRWPGPCPPLAGVSLARSLPLPAFPRRLASSARRNAVPRLQVAPAAPSSGLGGARRTVASTASAEPPLVSGCLESSGRSRSLPALSHAAAARAPPGVCCMTPRPRSPLARPNPRPAQGQLDKIWVQGSRAGGALRRTWESQASGSSEPSQLPGHRREGGGQGRPGGGPRSTSLTGPVELGEAEPGLGSGDVRAVSIAQPGTLKIGYGACEGDPQSSEGACSTPAGTGNRQRGQRELETEDKPRMPGEVESLPPQGPLKDSGPVGMA